jgi:hypothetical protein
MRGIANPVYAGSTPARASKLVLLIMRFLCAGVAEPVDALALGASIHTDVGVRPSPPAPCFQAGSPTSEWLPG